MNDLAGRNAIVTGAGGDLGRAISIALSQAGASVLITDIDLAEAECTLSRLTKTHAESGIFRLDVASEDEWKAALRHAELSLGPVTILVNNAGINCTGTVEDVSLERFMKVLLTNTGSQFLGMQTLIPHMARAGGGAIVNISSTTVDLPRPATTVYAASKAAITSLTRSTAIHCAEKKYGIRVNAIHPGPIDAGLCAAMIDTAPNKQQLREGIESKIPLGRMGYAQDVADAVVFLASERARYITGTSLRVDGGFTA
jgi:NAD(P)-dependent dehydrogenase (short-subunit alcohol dehydrogenase family)